MTLRHPITCLLLAVAVAACGDEGLSSRDVTDVLFEDLGTPDTTLADTTPADTTPADTTPADTTPADTTPADSTPADTTPADTAEADTQTDTAPDVVAACDHNGFTAVAQDALGFPTGDTWYIAQSTLSAPVDVFSIEIYAELGGATSPGTYVLADDNYDSCANCVLVQVGCDADLANCAKTFLATAGTMTVSAIGAVGEQFTATLTDLILTEITYDGEWHSTPVAGGQTWCIDRYEADVTLQ